MLTINGFDADIVIGEVDVMGNFEYEATLENIRKDYLNPDLNNPQPIHAWVTVGDDVIIDAGLSARLVKYYKMPPHQDPKIIIEQPKSHAPLHHRTLSQYSLRGLGTSRF